MRVLAKTGEKKISISFLMKLNTVAVLNGKNYNLTQNTPGLERDCKTILKALYHLEVRRQKQLDTINQRHCSKFMVEALQQVEMLGHTILTDLLLLRT